MCTFLVSFLMLRQKYPHRSNFNREKFCLAYSCRIQSVIAGSQGRNLKQLLQPQSRPEREWICTCPSQLVLSVALKLGQSPLQRGETLLLKTPHTVATRYVEINFKATWILSPCQVAMLVLEDTMQAAGGKDISDFTQHSTPQVAIYQARCSCLYHSCMTCYGVSKHFRDFILGTVILVKSP